MSYPRAFSSMVNALKQLWPLSIRRSRNNSQREVEPYEGISFGKVREAAIEVQNLYIPNR